MFNTTKTSTPIFNEWSGILSQEMLERSIYCYGIDNASLREQIGVPYFKHAIESMLPVILYSPSGTESYEETISLAESKGYVILRIEDKVVTEKNYDDAVEVARSFLSRPSVLVLTPEKRRMTPRRTFLFSIMKEVEFSRDSSWLPDEIAKTVQNCYTEGPVTVIIDSPVGEICLDHNWVFATRMCLLMDSLLVEPQNRLRHAFLQIRNNGFHIQEDLNDWITPMDNLYSMFFMGFRTIICSKMPRFAEAANKEFLRQTKFNWMHGYSPDVLSHLPKAPFIIKCDK